LLNAAAAMRGTAARGV